VCVWLPFLTAAWPMQECFPYISRRLLVDNDPRIQVQAYSLMQAALQHLTTPHEMRHSDAWGRRLR
jgi:hypothetical protein